MNRVEKFKRNGGNKIVVFYSRKVIVKWAWEGEGKGNMEDDSLVSEL